MMHSSVLPLDHALQIIFRDKIMKSRDCLDKVVEFKVIERAKSVWRGQTFIISDAVYEDETASAEEIVKIFAQVILAFDTRLVKVGVELFVDLISQFVFAPLPEFRETFSKIVAICKTHDFDFMSSDSRHEFKIINRDGEYSWADLSLENLRNHLVSSELPFSLWRETHKICGFKLHSKYREIIDQIETVRKTVHPEFISHQPFIEENVPSNTVTLYRVRKFADLVKEARKGLQKKQRQQTQERQKRQRAQRQERQRVERDLLDFASPLKDKPVERTKYDEDEQLRELFEQSSTARSAPRLPAASARSIVAYGEPKRSAPADRAERQRVERRQRQIAARQRAEKAAREEAEAAQILEKAAREESEAAQILEKTKRESETTRKTRAVEKEPVHLTEKDRAYAREIMYGEEISEPRKGTSRKITVKKPASQVLDTFISPPRGRLYFHMPGEFHTLIISDLDISYMERYPQSSAWAYNSIPQLHLSKTTRPGWYNIMYDRNTRTGRFVPIALSVTVIALNGQTEDEGTLYSNAGTYRIVLSHQAGKYLKFNRLSAPAPKCHEFSCSSQGAGYTAFTISATDDIKEATIFHLRYFIGETNNIDLRGIAEQSAIINSFFR
jgi:hypothetical protein